MSGCCAPAPREGCCPRCGGAGRPVPARTLECLLRPGSGPADLDGWRFCAAPGCEAVYFRGGDSLTEAALRVGVHAKHPEDPEVPVCYCYGHTPRSIAEELRAAGRTTVVERITAEVKAGRCRCTETNPKGGCCLGDVRAVVRRLTMEDET